MSRKKQLAVYTLCFMLVYLLLLVVLLPAQLAGEGVFSLAWYYAKLVFISFSAAAISSMLCFILCRPKELEPYATTFRRFAPLLRLLVERDFKTRYKRSVLGVLWSLLNPLFTMLVMTIVFSYLFRFEIPNFPVYLLGGQIIFGFFSESTNMAMQSVIGGAAIIKKVYVPKYIFPLSKVLSSLVNLSFSFLAFLLVFIITGAPWQWTFALFPIPLIYTFVFSLGVSMLLSGLVVFFRDLTYLYGIFLVALTYLTPLFYPVSILPDTLRQIMGFNPMFHYVDYFRSVTLYGTIPGLMENVVCISFALLALIGGTYVFMSKQDRYILYV